MGRGPATPKRRATSGRGGESRRTVAGGDRVRGRMGEGGTASGGAAAGQRGSLRHRENGEGGEGTVERHGRSRRGSSEGMGRGRRTCPGECGAQAGGERAGLPQGRVLGLLKARKEDEEG